MDYFTPPPKADFKSRNESPHFRLRVINRMKIWVDKKLSEKSAPDLEMVGCLAIDSDDPRFNMREKEAYGFSGPSPFDTPESVEVYVLNNGSKRMVFNYLGEEPVSTTPYPVPGKMGGICQSWG